MPTLPLHTPPSHPDASHRVTAPGGYEWWYFDAEDPARGLHVVGILLDGFVFHPGYLRAAARFRRRPTRTRPPVPADYPCAYLALYEQGRLAAQFMTQYPPGSLEASAAAPDVTLGLNRLQPRPDGSLHLTLCGTPWTLTFRGPRLLESLTLSADLAFAPRLPSRPTERTFLSRAMTGAEHHWVVADPLCDVRGSIALTEGPPATSRRAWDFAGRGYHDHNYGTGPLGPGLARWVWGRCLLDDRALTFHHAVPRDDALPAETHLLDATPDAVIDLSHLEAEADWSSRTPLLLAYPRTLRFGRTLALSNPRVVDSAPFYMRLLYDAQVEAGGAARRATAFCEVAYPHRLLVPILGRMIEMSIDRRPTP